MEHAGIGLEEPIGHFAPLTASDALRCLRALWPIIDGRNLSALMAAHRQFSDVVRR